MKKCWFSECGHLVLRIPTERQTWDWRLVFDYHEADARRLWEQRAQLHAVDGRRAGKHGSRLGRDLGVGFATEEPRSRSIRN